ncbi:MAG TPA: hypothetical protein VK172_10245 [Lentimicrobium sp.]|nr:hypothetical protein [Lentimicrobium sp.]
MEKISTSELAELYTSRIEFEIKIDEYVDKNGDIEDEHLQGLIDTLRSINIRISDIEDALDEEAVKPYLNNMKTFTKYQKEEIIALIEIRQETILEDPESADEFEANADSLQVLMNKVICDDMNFSREEKLWLISELDNRISVANDNLGSEGTKVLGLVRSLRNAIDKINQ